MDLLEKCSKIQVWIPSTHVKARHNCVHLISQKKRKAIDKHNLYPSTHIQDMKENLYIPPMSLHTLKM